MKTSPKILSKICYFIIYFSTAFNSQHKENTSRNVMISYLCVFLLYNELLENVFSEYLWNPFTEGSDCHTYTTCKIGR